MTTPASPPTSTQVYLQSARYLDMVHYCWDRSCFYRQKTLMEQFVVLQRDEAELLPGRMTLEDMSDWLVSQRNLPECLRVAASEEESDLARLTFWINTNLSMRLMELQVSRDLHDDLSEADQQMDSRRFSYRADRAKAEVAKALRSISRTVAFQPCSHSCSPADVLVDLVPRLLLSLTHQDTQDPWQDGTFLTLSDLAVTMVLEVLDKLLSIVKGPPPEVDYCRATGINMVHKVLSKISKRSHVEELNSTGLVSSVTETVTALVQRLFERPPDFIVAQTAFSWLSEVHAEKSMQLPENPQDLVLHADTLRSVIGLALTQICDGDIEAHIDLHNCSFVAEVENLLTQCNVKVSKKVEKVNWHLDPLDIIKMATRIHNYIHSLFGTKLIMKRALSARVHLMTRAITYIVVRELLTLREALHGEVQDSQDKPEDDEGDTETDYSSGDVLQDIITLFLQKLLTVADEMGDHLNPNCLPLAALMSTLVYSIVDRAGQTRLLFQQLAQLKLSDSLDSVADTVYMDYMSRFSSPEDRRLEAFTADRKVLVANMVADKLLGRTSPQLSRSTTHFELNPTAQSWGKAKGDPCSERTATQAGERATQVGRARAEPQSAGVKPKKSRIARFFLRAFRYCFIKQKD